MWLFDFGKPIGREQAGRRPAVVVSADPLNEGPAGVIIVVPTTTTPRGLPSHVEIDPQTSGMKEVGYAKCEDVKSVSEQQLITRIGTVPAQEMFQIGRTIRFLLDL